MRKHMLLVMLCLFGAALSAQNAAWQNSIERLFTDAKGLYDKQLYNPAKTKFEQILTNTEVPVHTRWKEESSYYSAMCALYLMNKDAEDLLNKFILTYPASALEQKAAFTAADYFFNKRQYRKAKEWFGKVDKQELNSEQRAEFYFKLGYAQLQSREREEAKLSFYEVKNSEAQYGASARYYYAHIAYEDSNYTTALENFEPLLDNPSFGPVVPYYLAQIYYQQKDYDKLLAYGEPLLERATKSRKPEISKLLGEAYLTKQEFEKAANFLEIYKDNGGRMRREDYYSLGYAYFKTERYTDAIANFNKIAGAKGDLAQNAYYHLGYCYIKTENKQEALSAFKAATESGENERIHEDALFNYAKLNYELANPYGSAIKAFQQFLKTYPNTGKKGEANKYLANLYLTTKDYENALTALSNTGLRSKEMKEAYQKVAYFRGVQLYNAAKLDQARNLFAQSLDFPTNATYVALANYWTAESYYRQEDFANCMKAIATFEATPGSYNLTEFASARYTKAYCYFMQNDFANAITTFRLFVDNKKAEPKKVTDAKLRLGDAYFMQRNYSTAIKYYKQYLATEPQDADYALFQKALCQGLNGDNNAKLATLDKLVKKYPQSRFAVDGLYEQGATLLTMDKNNQALSIFTDFVNKFPQSQNTRRAWLNIGIIYRNLDEDKKAIKTFKKVVEDYPATPEANEAIAFNRLVYAKQNKLDKYVEWVETIGFADIKRGSLDSTMYTTAMDFYSTGNCQDARTAFDSYVRKFPDGIFTVQANYFLGECAYQAKDDSVAAKALTRVINEPRSEYTERAISMLASIYMTAENYQEALTYYEQLLNFSEEITELRKARLGAMRCAVKLDIPTKALQFSEIILNDERTQANVKTEAMVVRARSYYKLEDYNNAHESFVQVKDNTSGESQAEAAYYISKIQNANQEFAASNETIFWMIDKLPSYQKWRYKALLIMANNYYELDDAFQANYTLDFIIDENYSPEIVAEAQQQKDAIRRAEELEQQAQEAREQAKDEEVVELEKSTEELDPETGGNEEETEETTGGGEETEQPQEHQNNPKN